MSDMQPLTEEQINFVINKVSTWLDTKQEFEEIQSCVSRPDVEHSALLPYLLRGNEPFIDPPPLRYSQPDYDLASGKPVQVQEVCKTSLAHVVRNNKKSHEELTLTHDELSVIIDHYAGWTWADEEKGILLHKRSNERYVLKDSVLQKLER